MLGWFVDGFGLGLLSCLIWVEFDRLLILFWLRSFGVFDLIVDLWFTWLGCCEVCWTFIYFVLFGLLWLL